MCLKCDGYSDEEIARGVELIIATNGWMVQGVEGDSPNSHDGFRLHDRRNCQLRAPELVIVGMDYVIEHNIVDWPVEQQRYG